MSTTVQYWACLVIANVWGAAGNVWLSALWIVLAFLMCRWAKD
jgi:hypothetical protein